MTKPHKLSANENGLTLIELLITIAILAVLIIMALMTWQNKIAQARDAERKSNLEKIRIAFEEYYNDKECFPEETILQICDGNSLNPYLDKIPCDPTHHLPYCYIHDPDNPVCGQSYKLLAPLQDNNDPVIEELLCHVSEVFCGYEENCAAAVNLPGGSNYGGFNYGVTSGGTQLYNPNAPAPPASSTPAPSPSSSPDLSGDYACTPQGICDAYEFPEQKGCPITYDNNTCDDACSNPANRCTR